MATRKVLDDHRVDERRRDSRRPVGPGSMRRDGLGFGYSLTPVVGYTKPVTSLWRTGSIAVYEELVSINRAVTGPSYKRLFYQDRTSKVFSDTVMSSECCFDPYQRNLAAFAKLVRRAPS